MAARGRGKGRGRGSQMSFDYNQLGFSSGEALPAPVLQPPPTYPPLEHKPVPLKSGPETEYMVALKRDFVEFLQSIRQINDSSSTIERFSDKYQVNTSDLKETWESQICWSSLPSELNPKGKKTKRKLEKINSGVPAKARNIDISIKLEELAKLEDKEEDETEETKEEDKEDDENENQENLEEEDEDEEMDDGTDYVNNYFDNGENYFDDEDDNLDDGPVY